MSGGSKKNLVSTLPRAERVTLIERGDAALPLVVQAERLSSESRQLVLQGRATFGCGGAAQASD